jgi:hypothetical protein
MSVCIKFNISSRIESGSFFFFFFFKKKATSSMKISSSLLGSTDSIKSIRSVVGTRSTNHAKYRDAARMKASADQELDNALASRRRGFSALLKLAYAVD